MCAQSCRWKYALVEEFRPGKYLPFAEDSRGSYIFNSKDLCMIEYIPEMMESGINAFKIEGRMKGINYLASTVKVYREAIDAYLEDPGEYHVKKDWIAELSRITHRGYCTGFYFGDPDQTSLEYESKNLSGQTFIGKVVDSTESLCAKIEVRNKIYRGDAIEVLRNKGPIVQDEIVEIYDKNERSVSFAQPGSCVSLLLNRDYASNDLIRRKETACRSEPTSPK